MLLSADEVSVQTKQTYTGDDLEQVESFIGDISAAVETFCRKEFSEPVPRAVKAVAMMEVRRLLNSEPGVAAERISDLSTSYAYGGAAFVLSSSAKDDLLSFLKYTRPSVGYIRLFSPLKMLSIPPPFGLQAGVIGSNVYLMGQTYGESWTHVQYTTDGFEWLDLAFTESQDRSDGDFPRWRATLVAPVPGSYKFRARSKDDGDFSGWSDVTSSEVT